MRDFQPSVLTNPAPVDIESFVENYLGMTPDYQLLSHNGIYLGMTVFNDTNRVIVFSQETGRAEYISAKAHTVIIDTRLLEENQQHRYRFTLGHEGGHDIFHTGYFSYDPNQTCMFDMAMTPMIQCGVAGKLLLLRHPHAQMCGAAGGKQVPSQLFDGEPGQPRQAGQRCLQYL